jgi:hypothetical protein
MIMSGRIKYDNGKSFILLADKKLSASAINLDRKRGLSPHYRHENSDSIISPAPLSLDCWIQNTSSQSATGWWLSWRQYGRRAKRSSKHQQWRL